MALVFAYEGTEVGEDNDLVNEAVCPTCGALLARAMPTTTPMAVEGYTIDCFHTDEPAEGAEPETVEPVWSQV